MMGYVPPRLTFDDLPGLLILPKNVTYQNVEGFRNAWFANAAYPRMVVIPPGLPRTFDEYRRSLYGTAQTDWLPALGWAFVVTLAVGIAAILVGLFG